MIFFAGVLAGLGAMAFFENTVWMQTRRVLYDLDRDGRERAAEIKARERANINACRVANGLDPLPESSLAATERTKK